MNNQTLSKALSLISDMTSEARVEMIKTSPYGEELFMGYYFSEYIKVPFAPFHFEMFQDWRDLQSGKIRELAWIMFRESAKSSIAKVLMTKAICFRERLYLNVDGFDKNNSETFLFDVAQNLLTNRRIIKDFGFLYEKKRSSDEMTLTRIGKFLTKNNVLMEAHSVAESVRGRIYQAQRPDFVCADDFETNKTRYSEAYTAVTKSHIEEFATGLDSKASILYLGNYITKTGVVQWIMDRALEDTMIRVRMVAIEEEGKPTWEEKYCMTDEEADKTGKISLESKKRQFGNIVYQTEMMNNPIGDEFQVFKKEMFKYITYDEVMMMNCRVFMTIDTAISQKTNADYTGICLNFVDREGFWNFMTFKRRMTPRTLIDFIFEYQDKYHIETIGIEKTTFQMALKEFFEEEMRKRNKYPHFVDLLHKGQKKEERIRGGLLGRYESGSIRHITGYCNGLEDELLSFPGGKNDDVCTFGLSKVKTINGDVSIMDISAGDMVLTRKGYRKVLWAGKTGTKKVITRFGLSATPNHLIWTANGWKSLDTVREYDIIKVCEKQLSTMEKNIIVTPIQRGDSTVSIFGDMINVKNLQLHSIARFGLIVLERLKKVWLFIIKMVILLTMKLKISNLKLIKNTANIICEKMGERIFQKKISKEPEIFTKQKKEKFFGIFTIGGNQKWLQNFSYVKIVIRYLKIFLRTFFCSVVQNVKIDGIIEKKTNH